MSLLWLGDNALFLKNLRERTRPSSLAAAAIATALATILCVLGCYTVSLGDKGFRWEAWAFYTLAIVQTLVLLVMGSVSLSNSAARERLANTLDFHRASPTTPLNMYVGLLLGGPVHEWCVYLAILPVGASFGLRGGLSLAIITYLHLSIILNALLFHSLSIVFTMGIDQKTLNRMLSVGGLTVCLVLAYVSFAAAGSPPARALYHLTCLPAFVTAGSSLGMNGPAVPLIARREFFQVQMPIWAVQIVVQCPVILLASLASMRRLAHAERPLFSKVLALAACAYALLVYLGPMGPETWQSMIPDSTDFFRLIGAVFFCGFVFILGCMGTCMTTPSYLMHVRALRRMRKNGRHYLSPFEDGASNFAWLVLFSTLAAGAMVVLLWFWHGKDCLYAFVLLALTLCYVAWFAGGYELAMLAGKGKRKGLMVVAFAVPWAFMPILGSLLAAGSMRLDLLHTMMMAFCPFFGISMFAGAYIPAQEVAEFMWLALAMNLVLAFVVSSIAWSTRIRLYREQT